MREVVAGAFLAIAAMTVATSPAVAKTVTVPVHLTLTVANSCTIVTPPTVAGSSGAPSIALGSVIPDCLGQGVSAALYVERASLKEGSYIATIDF